MNFNQFKKHIPAIKKVVLGGLKVQLELAPKMRKQFSMDMIKANNPKESAVLAIFYPDKENQTRFLLTQRASYMGTHSAQVSFPGGKKDINDKDLIHTAKRETHEEVGVHPNDVAILKQMTPTYIPPSNYLVSPYLGFINKIPTFKPNYEVKSIIEIKLKDLLDDSNLDFENMSTSYMNNIDVPCFKLNNYIVWGATAMILNEIKNIFHTL